MKRQQTKTKTKSSSGWSEVLLVEDNASRAERREIAGLSRKRAGALVVVRIHRVIDHAAAELGKKSYRPRRLKKGHGVRVRSDLALSLLDVHRRKNARPLVLAGTNYGSNGSFLKGVIERGFPFIVEVRPSELVELVPDGRSAASIEVPAGSLLADAEWRKHRIASPNARAPMLYKIAKLGRIRIEGGVGVLFACQIGGINGLHPGTIIGVSSLIEEPLKEVVKIAGWIRWIRPMTRLVERREASSDQSKACHVETSTNGFKFRSNIKLSRRSDAKLSWGGDDAHAGESTPRLSDGRGSLNVVELFAGAGGMGLGFLLAGSRERRFRIIASGEVNPIFVATLKNNHSTFAARSGRPDSVPSVVEPVNLAKRHSLGATESLVKSAGGVAILIGGPPCQGFSNANRNSWDPSNPHNGLVDVFVRYVERLKPPVFLMENVQGILWTQKNGSSTSGLNVVDALSRRLRRAGYELFPKLLDAVWYGVPQHRSRFFLLGLHRDLGYRETDFGEWGPFPRPTHGPGTENPYATVKCALHDLPRIGNGHQEPEIDYTCPRSAVTKNEFLAEMRRYAANGVIHDHVTSRHADYVIERYRRIPQGGNWEDIEEELTNYANVSRTHSNIYRRLKWNEPAITIGHYRKSMLVHPNQHRGISLREASRLQSFPDWFRFAGGEKGFSGGLVHKQQQLANAVCPLVTKAIAQIILGL